jgi:cytochrome P450
VIVSTPSLCSRDRSLRTEASGAYSGRVQITRADDVRAILGDPGFLVPRAPAADGAGGVAWLRASVGRFANGEVHARRRALGIAELARLDCADLEREACARAERLLGTTGRKPFDLMARIARPAAVEVLAEALGLPGVTAADVAVAARAYPPATRIDKKAGGAVERLVTACGGTHDEATATRIGLLVQACDATAGLAANALIALLTSARGGSPAAIVAAALRDDPPVRATRRIAEAATSVGDVAIPAGTIVTLDLTAARDDQLPFGAGPRRCPGREQALALAIGIVTACRGCRLAEAEMDYAPAANLGSPGSLMLLR